jgi:hypothetical protein
VSQNKAEYMVLLLWFGIAKSTMRLNYMIKLKMLAQGWPFALFSSRLLILSLFTILQIESILMQKTDGTSDLINPGAALLWAILFYIGYPIYIQGSLNNHWHGHAIKVPKIGN